MNDISWPVVKHHFRQEPSRAGWAAHPASAEPRFGARALKAGVSFPACNYRAGNRISANGVGFWGWGWTRNGPGIPAGDALGTGGGCSCLGQCLVSCSHGFHTRLRLTIKTRGLISQSIQRSVLLPSAALARCSALCTTTNELSDSEHLCEDRSAAPV